MEEQMKRDSSVKNLFILIGNILVSSLFIGTVLVYCIMRENPPLYPPQVFLILIICFFWLVFRQISSTPKQRDVFISSAPHPTGENINFDDLPLENTFKRDFKSFAIINVFVLAFMSLFGSDLVYNPFLAICIMLAFYFPFLRAVSWIFYRRFSASESGFGKTSLPKLYAKTSIFVPILLVTLLYAFPAFNKLEMALLFLAPFLLVGICILIFSVLRGIDSLLILRKQKLNPTPSTRFKPLPLGQIIFIAILCPLLFGIEVDRAADAHDKQMRKEQWERLEALPKYSAKDVHYGFVFLTENNNADPSAKVFLEDGKLFVRYFKFPLENQFGEKIAPKVYVFEPAIEAIRRIELFPSGITGSNLPSGKVLIDQLQKYTINTSRISPEGLSVDDCAKPVKNNIHIDLSMVEEPGLSKQANIIHCDRTDFIGWLIPK